MGSKQCFYINGVAGAKLKLTPGKQYTFAIDTPGHPFYFTTSERGGSEDENEILGFPPTDKGIVAFTMPDEHPNAFYYQCRIHAYMGSYAETESHNTFYIDAVLGGLVAPTSLAVSNEDDNHFYVADQPGQVYKCNLRTRRASIFLDVSKNVPKLNANYDERGLLGLCFHPQFAQNGRVFIFYSSIGEYEGKRPVGNEYYNCLSEFVYANGKINYDTERTILRIRRDLNFHNGGKINFGPDGYLYLALGDGGPQRDPNNHAQDLSTWFGKILRIDVNGVPNYPYYRVPQDNPFVGVQGAKPEIWAYGFRNPWGLEFGHGALIVTDSGFESGSGQEEVNVVVKGGNYGWNVKEGTRLAPWTQPETDTSDMIDPIFAYTTADPQFADRDSSVIIGGRFTHDGDYVCADFSGRLIRLRFDGESANVVETGKTGKWIRSIDKGTNGQLYVLTSENTGPKGTTGEVYSLRVE